MSKTKITWLGHASIKVEAEGKASGLRGQRGMRIETGRLVGVARHGETESQPGR